MTLFLPCQCLCIFRENSLSLQLFVSEISAWTLEVDEYLSLNTLSFQLFVSWFSAWTLEVNEYLSLNTLSLQLFVSGFSAWTLRLMNICLWILCLLNSLALIFLHDSCLSLCLSIVSLALKKPAHNNCAIHNFVRYLWPVHYLDFDKT